MGLRWNRVVIEAADPARLGRWWAEVLGYPIMHEEHGELMIGPDLDLPCIYFTPAHADKAGKNRLHLDLSPTDQEAEVERLLDMGARHIDIGQGDVGWVVLADPEGNEFCVLQSRGED
ncbi:VOC family protein [Hamadaea tsunoensis]|uniref:VOC family protein n=1 Tax=Hamadaea tsunoensis TaxID=53368 RepID=UPI0004845D45|nr:VOC family protein [Hamadaea tsunoensis]